jgi:hypothetical protein
VKTLGGDDIRIHCVKYFQFKFEPQLLSKVKDISSLEDVQQAVNGPQETGPVES